MHLRELFWVEYSHGSVSVFKSVSVFVFLKLVRFSVSVFQNIAISVSVFGFVVVLHAYSKTESTVK